MSHDRTTTQGFSVRRAIRVRAVLASIPALVAAGLTSWGATCFAQSDTPATDQLRFSGFGTLGLVHTQAPDGWSYRRDISQGSSSRSLRADLDSRLGLQLNYAATPEVEFAGQVLVARRSPAAQALDHVEWAYAAFRPLPEWALRIGRVNLDEFLLSDYRDVGFAYSYVRPPVDFYASIPSRLDGADLTRTWDLGDARWRVKAFVGRLRTGDLNLDAKLLISPAFGLTVSREADGLLVRASLSRGTLGGFSPSTSTLVDSLKALAVLPIASVADEATMLRQRLDYAHTASTYAALGVSYELDDWQFSAEATRVKGHPLASMDTAYAFVARRFGPVTGFAGFSRIWKRSSPVTTPNWAEPLEPVFGDDRARQVQYLGAVAASIVNEGSPDQHTSSFGARWDIHPQLALKLQWDHVDTNPFGGRLWANATDAGAQANITSVTLDFVF